MPGGAVAGTALLSGGSGQDSSGPFWRPTDLRVGPGPERTDRSWSDYTISVRNLGSLDTSAAPHIRSENSVTEIAPTQHSGDPSLTAMATKAKPQRDSGREVLRHLGERVRSIRHNRGLTQEALAEALDLSVAYISLIERGGRNPPYTTVLSIARALQVRMSEMCVDE